MQGLTPRLPDLESGGPPSSNTKLTYHDALRAANELHWARMADGNRRHRVSAASAGGFLVFAGLVAGLVVAGHAMWSNAGRAANDGTTVGSVMFSVTLPSPAVRSDHREVVLGAQTQVSRWTASTADAALTVSTIDTDFIFPGEAADPTRAAAMLEEMQRAVVADVAQRSVGTVAATASLQLHGRSALQNLVTAGGVQTSVTTAMHGSILVSVVCEGTSADLPTECRAVLDSLTFR
jgi:hypothetical protein